MFNFDFGSWLSWLLPLGISGGLATYAALYFFGGGQVLKMLGAVVENVAPILAPIAKEAGEWFGWFLRAIREGIADIFDSGATLLTVALMLLAFGFWFRTSDNAAAVAPCQQQVQALKKEVAKHVQPRRTDKQSVPGPLDWLRW